MNLIWHIVKKDLRRLWAPLALWSLLVMAQIAVGMTLLWSNGAADPAWFARMADYSHLLLTLDLLFAYVLVSALVHDDSLVGPHVFWRTRPLSGGRLLGAKLLTAVLMFGALPVLIWLPWWLACHYGWRDVAGAVPEILGTHAVAVMAALLVATLTDTLGRFLAWTIMLTITLATLGMASLARLSLAHVRWTGAWHSLEGLTETRVVVIFALLMTVTVIVVLQQFVARRPNWVFAQVLAGFAVAALIAAQWPWDWSIAWLPAFDPPKFEQSQELAKDITLTVDQARLWQSPRESPALPYLSQVAVGLLAQGIPEGLEMYGRFAEQTWRWSDGQRVYRVGRAFGSAGSPAKALGLPTAKMDPDYLKWSEVRRPRYEMQPSLYAEIEISWNGAHGLIPSAGLTRAEAARIKAEPPAYTLKAQFGLVRPAVLWELPLRLSDRHWVNQLSLRVVKAAPYEAERGKQYAPTSERLNSMHVTLIESRPSSYTDGLVELSPFKGLREWYEEVASIREWSDYFLVNRERGNLSHGYAQKFHVRIGTVDISQVIADFRAPSDWRGDGNWESQPHWFEQATLVNTEAHEVGRFRREVTVDHFETQP